MAATPPAANTLGTLVVVVIRAKNLRDKHTFTKQDPFVTIQLGKEKKSTEIDKRGGQHPVWDVDLHLPVSRSTSKDSRTLKVSCFSKEPREDDLVGAGEVDISEILEKGEFDDWVKLKEDDAYRGEVYLEMTFFSAANNKPHARRKPQMPQSERLQYQSQQHSPTPPISNTLPAPNSGNNVPGGSALRPQASPPRRPDALPPPAILQPGHGAIGGTPPRRPPPPTNNTIPTSLAPGGSSKLQPVPSILRPGNAKASPIPIPDHPRPQPAAQEQAPSTSSYNFGFPEPQAQAPLPYPGESSYPPGNANLNGPPPSFPSFPGGGATSNYYEARSNQIDHHPNGHPYPYGRDSGGGGGTSNNVSDYGNEYAARERAALARASQEDADEELARILSENENKNNNDNNNDNGGGGVVGRVSQEQADEELARIMAQNEGIDLDRLRREEADREMARKLARELNAEVLREERANQASRQGVRTTNPMPGGW